MAETTEIMQTQSSFDKAILAEYFSDMEFTDQREKEVFLSYLHGFSLLFFDSDIRNIVEVGGGQSTAIFAVIASRFGYHTSRIGKNAVIGAGSIVVSDIPEGVFAAGNPAKTIREIAISKISDEQERLA